MLIRIIVWIIQTILIRKLRKVFGKDNLVAIKSLLNNYSCTENSMLTHKRNRPTYIKEFRKIGLNEDEFISELYKLEKKSKYLTICEDIYLATLFIKRCLVENLDMRIKKNQELFDETISHLDYLVFNYKL
jgi:hypothetical protein